MALKRIRHAMFEWFDPVDGSRHYAYRGEEVDVPESVVEQFARYEPFFEDVHDESGVRKVVAAEPDEVAAEPASAPVEPPAPAAVAAESTAPKRAATKEQWVEYAVARGFDRDEVAGMSKDDLIAALG